MSFDADSRVVMTLDAGGTSFRFSAIRACKPVVNTITMPAAIDDLKDCLMRLVEGFRRIQASCPEPPAAISFGFPGPADYPNGIIGDLGNLPAFRGGVALGPILEEQFGVPLVNLPLPIGVEAVDRFIDTLRELTCHPVPAQLALERGWLLDAMADSHKYNAEGRPVIYGEPEIVYALTRTCTENGAPPVVIASGTKNSRLSGLLVPVLADVEDKPVLLEETDFATIDEATALAGVNIGIGHSGGKFLTERRGIPVIRVGFPIHDRTGGQRILSVGYTGTLAFLDRFTNTLLESKYASYRTQIKEKMIIRSC